MSFRAIAGAVFDALVLVVAGRIADANAAAAACLGVESPADLSGRSLASLFEDAAVDALLGDVPAERRVRLADASGRSAVVRARPFPHPGATGPAHVVAIRPAEAGEPSGADEDARFRAIFDAAYGFMGLLGPDGRVREINRTALDVFGLTRAEVIGRSLADVYRPMLTEEGAARLAAAAHEALGGRFVRYEAEGVVAGVPIVVDVSLTPVTDAHGAVAQVVVEGRDVTERKRSEAAARAGADRLRALMDAAADAIVMTGAEGRISGWNRGAEAMFGYTTEEAIGLPVETLMPAKYVPGHRGGMHRVNTTGETHVIGRTVEMEGVRRDGEVFPLELSLSHWRQDGQPYYSAILRDVTERHRANEALRESQTRLSRAQAIAHVGSWEWNMEDDALSWSDELYRIYGLEPGAPISFERYSSLVHPDDRAENHATISRALERGEPFEVNHRVVRPDGTERFVHGEGIPLQRPDGTVWGAAGTAHDVTEQRAAEETLARTNRHLEQRNRELQEFAYVASHDLQEPLRKISMFASLLSDEYGPGLDGQGRSYVDRMQDAAGRMARLISDLLGYSRVATREGSFVPVNLNTLVGDVLSALEVALGESGARVEVGPLPTVVADPTQMHQLFQNLIGNAVKFHRPGEPPAVRVSAENVGDRCTVTVSDEGIGFDEKYLDRIFSPFQRLHGRSAYAGTGMGLAICRRIAERHDGRLTARSAPGEGATFMVTLPLGRARGTGSTG